MKQESSNLEKIVSAVALAVVGICFVVWADKVTEWIAIALGALALIVAIVRAVRFFRLNPEQRTTTDLFSVILIAAVGVLLVSRANFVKEAISFIIGVYIVLSCSVQLMILSGLRRHGIMVSRACPIVGVMIGILCITGQFIIPDALAVVTGVALIIYGVVYIIGLVIIQKATNKAKASQKKIVEATVVKEAKEAELTNSSPKTKK